MRKTYHCSGLVHSRSIKRVIPPFSRSFVYIGYSLSVESPDPCLAPDSLASDDCASRRSAISKASSYESSHQSFSADSWLGTAYSVESVDPCLAPDSMASVDWASRRSATSKASSNESSHHSFSADSSSGLVGLSCSIEG